MKLGHLFYWLFINLNNMMAIKINLDTFYRAPLLNNKDLVC